MPGPAHMQDLTLKKYLEAWEAGSAEGMLETFSSDVRQRTMPLALGIPSRGRKELEAFLPRLCECIQDWDVSHIDVLGPTVTYFVSFRSSRYSTLCTTPGVAKLQCLLLQLESHRSESTTTSMQSILTSTRVERRSRI